MKWTSSVIGLIGLIILLTGFTAQSPSRPEVLPTRPSPPSAPITGGWISLTISGHEQPTSLWTAVEWQNEHGKWYSIAGWRGSPNASGEVDWFVGSELVGDSNLFRWHVYDGEGGAWLATSDTFTMPEKAQMRSEVFLTLDDS